MHQRIWEWCALPDVAGLCLRAFERSGVLRHKLGRPREAGSGLAELGAPHAVPVDHEGQKSGNRSLFDIRRE